MPAEEQFHASPDAEIAVKGESTESEVLLRGCAHLEARADAEELDVIADACLRCRRSAVERQEIALMQVEAAKYDCLPPEGIFGQNRMRRQRRR
jgi:hypothetical protein